MQRAQPGHPPLSLPSRLLLAGVVLAGTAARWLTRTPGVYNWDSVHYVLAQDRYDILAHQPHPPGSFYYVLLARAARLLAGDPHSALLLLSCLFGGLLVLLLFFLGRELAGESAGWLAAAIGASAPLFWFYGSVGLNYGPAGALSALVALGCIGLCRGVRPLRSGLLAGVALGVLGGFRPTDVAFLAPAYLWSLGCCRRGAAGESGRRATGWSLAVAAALTLGWLVPNTVNTGGPAAYLQSIRSQEHLFARTSVLLAGLPAWNEAVLTHRRCLESTLGAAWILTAAGIFLRGWGMGSGVWGRNRRVQGSGFRVQDSGAGQLQPPSTQRPTPTLPVAVLGALIVLPAFAFYLLGHFNSPGYALVYSGFLAALGGAAAAPLVALPPHNAQTDLGNRGGRPLPLALLMAAVIALNAVLFLRGWPGVGRLGQRSLSYAEIRDHDRYYRELRAFLAARYRPGEVRILTSWNSTDGLRTVQALLPEYAGDVAQAVGAIPLLPPRVASLPFLRLMTPAQIRAEGRPVFAVMRTREDPDYHASLFGTAFEAVKIGRGHEVYRLRETAPGSRDRSMRSTAPSEEGSARGRENAFMQDRPAAWAPGTGLTRPGAGDTIPLARQWSDVRVDEGARLERV